MQKKQTRKCYGKSHAAASAALATSSILLASGPKDACSISLAAAILSAASSNFKALCLLSSAAHFVSKAPVLAAARG